MNAMIRGEEAHPPVAELIGFRGTSIETGKAIRARVRPAAREPHGHAARRRHLRRRRCGDGCGVRVDFWSGKRLATARVVKAGKTIGLTECDVTDTEGRLVARAMSMCMTLRGDLIEGR
jgi:hypothetical protein